MKTQVIPSFLVSLPDGWQDQTAYSIAGPEAFGRAHIITIIVDRNPGTHEVSEFAKGRTASMAEEMGHPDILKDEPMTMPRGAEGYEFVFRWMPSEGIRIYRRYLFRIIDDVGYTLQCDFSKRTLKTLGLEMLQIADSLEHPDE